MKIQTSLKSLQAAQLFVSTDDNREAIQHLCIEASKAGNVRIISTNGRCMSLLNSGTVADWKGAEPKATQLLVKFPEKLIQNMKADRIGVVWIEPVGDEIVFTAMGSKAKVVVPWEKELTYPNWRQVVPKTELQPCSLSLDYDLLAQFGKASKILTGKSHIKVYGHKVSDDNEIAPYSVCFGQFNNGYGLIMPIIDEAFVIPTWATNAEE